MTAVLHQTVTWPSDWLTRTFVRVSWSRFWICVLAPPSCLPRSEPSPLSVSTSVMWVIPPACSRSHQEKRSEEERTRRLWNGELVRLREIQSHVLLADVLAWVLYQLRERAERELCSRTCRFFSKWLLVLSRMSLNSSGPGFVVSWVVSASRPCLSSGFYSEQASDCWHLLIFIITSGFSSNFS